MTSNIAEITAALSSKRCEHHMFLLKTVVACAGVPLPARGTNLFDHDGQTFWPRASPLLLDSRDAQ